MKLLFKHSEKTASKFSLEIGVLPSYNLETGLYVRAVSIQWYIESCHFELLVSYNVKGFKQVEIAYLVLLDLG